MDRNQQSDPEQSSASTGSGMPRAIGIVIVVAILALVAWWFLRGSEPEPVTGELPTPVAEEVEPEPEPEPIPEPEPEPEPVVLPQLPVEEPEPEPEPEEPLPELNQSTGYVLESAREQGLDTAPVQDDNLIRRLTVFVDNLASGQVVREAAVIDGPQSRFLTQEIDYQLYIDERSYQRYDETVSWFVSLDTDALAENYMRFEPLFEEAYAEFSLPDVEFRDQVIAAIEMLLDTPEPSGLPALDDSEVMYTFADPELEQLPPAQKQMLRLGPENMQRVKSKLREFKEALEQSEN